MTILDEIISAKAATPQATELHVGDDKWEALMRFIESTAHVSDPRANCRRIYGLDIHRVDGDGLRVV